MRRGVPESEIKLSPFDTLMKAPGVTANEIENLDLPPEVMEGRRAFELEIGNLKKWEKWLKTPEALDLFADLALKAYGDRENPPGYDKNDADSVKVAIEAVANGDISAADKLMIIADQESVHSFLAYEVSEEDDGNFGYAYLNVTAPEHRGQGLGGSLMKKLYEKDLDGITGVTCTPAAFEIMLNAARVSGKYDLFFAGQRNGILGDKGTPEQQKKVAGINDCIKESFEEQGSFVEGVDFPPGYIPFKSADGPVQPPKTKEVAFNDPEVQKFFTETVVNKQKELGKKGTLYGIIAAVRKSN